MVSHLIPIEILWHANSGTPGVSGRNLRFREVRQFNSGHLVSKHMCITTRSSNQMERAFLSMLLHRHIKIHFTQLKSSLSYSLKHAKSYSPGTWYFNFITSYPFKILGGVAVIWCLLWCFTDFKRMQLYMNGIHTNTWDDWRIDNLMSAPFVCGEKMLHSGNYGK